MKKLLLFVLTIVSIVSAKAASDTTYYFDKNWVLCDKSESEYYRVVSFNNVTTDSFFFSSNYNLKGVLLSTSYYNRWGKGAKAGEEINYWENGKVKSKGNYKYWVSEKMPDNSKEDGLWTFWNEKGEKWLEKQYVVHTNDGSQDELYMNLWDSTGAQKIKDGNGTYLNTYTDVNLEGNKTTYFLQGQVKDGYKTDTWNCYYSTGKPYYSEKYEKGKLVKGESFDDKGTKYEYTTIEEYPEYPGGDYELLRFLSKNIQYPQYERDNDIQGRIVIRFVIDEKGNITDIKVVAHVSTNLDNEAIRVVNRLSPFKPGKQRGQPVKVYYNLPIVFRLQ